MKNPVAPRAPRAEGESVRAVLLFDGLCALCHGAVRLLARIDRGGVLAYAPLDGETTAEVAAQRSELRAIDGVVLVTTAPGGGYRLAQRSEALLGALRLVGRGWHGLAAALALLPRPLRDALYDLVARRRRRWFGEYDSCPPPPPSLRSRWLP